MNQCVVLIGATTSTGSAISDRFIAGGATVVGIALERSGNPALASEVVADCAHGDSADAAIREAMSTLGRIDVLVAAAGYEPVVPAHKTSEADWRLALSACLDTYFFTVRAAIPLMQSGSSIVAISSINSRVAAPWLAAYTAAKGGVDALTRQLAVDYGQRGIRVNAVSPGLIGAHRYPDAGAGYPLGHPVSPEEVAEAVYFLANPAASGINGVVLPVDGGSSITSPAASLRVDLQERIHHLND